MQPIIRNQWQGIAKIANDGNIESKIKLEIAPNVSVMATVSTAAGAEIVCPESGERAQAPD